MWTFVSSFSRSSFLTGRRPDTLRCYDNPALVRQNFQEVVTMPQYFKQHGYLTLGAGKVFHPGNSEVNLINRCKSLAKNAYSGNQAYSVPNDDYPASWSEELFHTDTTDNKEVSWHAHTDQELQSLTLRDVANAEHAVDTLKQIAPDAISGQQPFFFVMGFHKVTMMLVIGHPSVKLGSSSAPHAL